MVSLESSRRILSAIGWLSETPKDFREAILDRVMLYQFDRHQPVYGIGDDGGGLWGLVDGSLSIEYADETRSPSFLHYGLPGFWTGEFSLITGKPRIINMRAGLASTMVYLPRMAFLQVAEADPSAWRWVALLSLQHTVDLMGKVNDLTIPNAEQRVASVLLRMAGHFGSSEIEPGTTLTDVHIGQDTLANTCNLSRAALAEIIREFASHGMIRTGYRKITVVDPVRLSERIDVNV